MHLGWEWRQLVGRWKNKKCKYQPYRHKMNSLARVSSDNKGHSWDSHQAVWLQSLLSPTEQQCLLCKEKEHKPHCDLETIAREVVTHSQYQLSGEGLVARELSSRQSFWYLFLAFLQPKAKVTQGCWILWRSEGGEKTEGIEKRAPG